MNSPIVAPGQNAAEFSPERDDVFGRIASRYDILCDLFSLGIHRQWKRAVAREISEQPWEVLLDGATGTGDILLRVLSPGSAPDRVIVASDISPQMLTIARRRLAAHPQVRFETLNLESMPSVSENCIDAYSISLGLKICDREKALKEAFRVLRPGGRLVVLEASNIKPKFVHRAYLCYMNLCMPTLGWLATGGDASAYRYLLDGVVGFPTAENFAQEVREIGFVDVRFDRLSLGIVAIHVAQKPLQAGAA